jgi:hypothetical protein
VDLYIYSPIRFNGVVLNELSAGTTYLYTLATESIVNNPQRTLFQTLASVL